MTGLNLRIENEFGFLEFDQEDAKVNVLNTCVMQELGRILDDLRDKTRFPLKALFITSGKDGVFLAGADIKEIESIATSEEAYAKAQQGKAIFDKLEQLDAVTVAVINGVCLGGGLELALACRYRVAAFSDRVKLGLPEVKLGLIPGFGGTWRLPRLIGLQSGLSMIVSGEAVSSADALRRGLVDALFPGNRLMEEAVSFVQRVLESREARPRRKKKRPFISFLEDTALGRSILFDQAKKSILKKTKGFYPAPLKAVEVLSRTYGRQGGGDLESRAFGELALTAVSKNLIKVFYLNEEYKKINWAQAGEKPKEITACGVVGAGIMGGGIAQLVSFYEVPVRLKDVHYGALKIALKTAQGIFDYALKKKILRIPQADLRLGFISPTLTYKGFEKAGIVIEAVVEDLKVKQQVFSELSRIVPPSCVLVSNTSSLPIARIAESAALPERVAGMHFFNPVHRMPLVEVIRAKATSEETLATVVAFGRRIGKTVIVVRDVPGFLINRILLSYMNEAAYLFEEGVAPERIDRLARGFGMPMGPLELADEVGIDVGYKVAKILEESYGERMRVPSILEKIKEKKMFGRKTKAGFYLDTHKGKRVNQEVRALLGRGSSRDISDETALKRMLYVMVNEAARCLEEGVVDRSHVVDLGMIMGTGFPAFRGGLLRYADSVGAGRIVEDLMNFEKGVDAARFRPCALLVGMAEKNTRFYPEPEAAAGRAG